jgi:hypothetical protein
MIIIQNSPTMATTYRTRAIGPPGRWCISLNDLLIIKYSTAQESTSINAGSQTPDGFSVCMCESYEMIILSRIAAVHLISFSLSGYFILFYFFFQIFEEMRFIHPSVHTSQVLISTTPRLISSICRSLTAGGVNLESKSRRSLPVIIVSTCCVPPPSLL